MAPLVCAVANAVAVVALATVLAPATPLVADVAARQRYVDEHLLAWRLGWGSWMVAAATLLWFYAWWRERVGGPRWAVGVALIGMSVDIFAETLLVVPWSAGLTFAPLAFFLTGAVANGVYTIAGIALTRATRLDARANAYAAFMWSAGLMLSLGAIVGQPLITAIATAILFAFFVPWCLWLRGHLA